MTTTPTHPSTIPSLGRGSRLLIGLLGVALAVSTVALACPPGRGHHRGPAIDPDCAGQRLGAVRWQVRASHPAVGYDQTARVLVEVRLRAERVRSGVRRPIGIAIVLDRSGSMRGSKWTDAVEAARAAVRRLERGDVVSLVSYANDVRVDWPAQRFNPDQRDALMRVLDRMEPTGATFLEGGLRRGAEELARHVDRERPLRVLLVSDGNANVGAQSGHALQQIARTFNRDGVMVSTIGLGVDYNEDLMTAVADGGSGSYHYIRDSERLGETFQSEIERMLAVAARRITARIQPIDGVRVTRVLGYPSEPLGDGGVEIPLGELASEGERSLLVELEVRCDRRGRRSLAHVELALLDAEGERLHGHADLDVEATDDPRRVERERDMEVVGRHEEYRLSSEMRESAEMVSRGQGAEAQQRLRAAAARAKDAAAKGGSKALADAAGEAERRAEQAPKAAAAPSSEREDFKKATKARAYEMDKR